MNKRQRQKNGRSTSLTSIGLFIGVITILLAGLLLNRQFSAPTQAKQQLTLAKVSPAQIQSIQREKPIQPKDQCDSWKVGTMTVYNSSNSKDDNGMLPEYEKVTPLFRNKVPVVAIHSKDWPALKYHNIQMKWRGKIITVQAWDECADADCKGCCTANAKHFTKPGFLIDVEKQTAQRLFSTQLNEYNTFEKIQYRVCEIFNPKPVATMYGLINEENRV